jgi:hypothetical protein
MLRDIKTVLIAAFLSTPAFAFNVGPYKMGMTDAEARKVGIGACAPDRDQVNRVACDVRGVGVPSEGVREATIYFDRSKRIVEIKMVIENDFVKDVYPKLDIKDCPEKWSNGRWCFSPPSLERTIWSDYSRPCELRWCKGVKEPLRIHIEHDKARLQSFLAAKARDAKRKQLADSIQTGQ